MKNLALIVTIAFGILTSCKTSQASIPADILTATTWQLTHIDGKPLEASAYSREIPYINFTTDNKVTGNSGCNGFSGSYNLNDMGGMNISRVAATKMYCEGVKEGEFFEMLERVTMSKARKDKLMLFGGTKEVLTFVPKQ